MARPRKPTNVLALKGAFKEHADRGRARANEPVPVGEIGDPPEHLSAESAACWREIVGLAHAGTLCEGDRFILEHGAQILAELRAKKWKVHPTLMVRWEIFLAKLGLTPADRSRVSAVKNPQAKNDPLDEFRAVG